MDKSMEKGLRPYITLSRKGLLATQHKFELSENPKISIVISVYNGEAYLKTAVLSIQNQDSFTEVFILTEAG